MSNETARNYQKVRFAMGTHSFAGDPDDARCWWCDCRPLSNHSRKPCYYRPNITALLADAGLTWEDYE